MMKNCVLQTFVWSINRQPASDDTTPGDKREIGGITQNCVACRLNVETMESLNKHFCLYLHSQWGKYPLKPAWVHKAYIVGWMNIFCLINLLPFFCHDLAEGCECDVQCFLLRFLVFMQFSTFLPRSTFFRTFQTHSPNNEFILQNWITHISSHCHKHNRVRKVETVWNGDKNRNLLLYDVNSNLVKGGRLYVELFTILKDICVSVCRKCHIRAMCWKRKMLCLLSVIKTSERGFPTEGRPSWWEADQKMQFLPQYDPFVSLSKKKAMDRSIWDIELTQYGPFVSFLVQKALESLWNIELPEYDPFISFSV